MRGVVASRRGILGVARGQPRDSKDCTDFVTQPEAQAWQDFFLPFFGDVAKLDAEGDGIACEGLPATTS